MTILNNSLRPTEKFNPSNKAHRNYYTEFIKRGTWGFCPVRFYVEGDASNNNLAYAMQRKLVEFYVSKEFKLSVDTVADRI